MSFRTAVEACASVRAHYRKGLGGLKREHASLIEIADTRRLTGSLDLDKALEKAPCHASAHRWDYGIGYLPKGKKRESAVWVEVHPANTGEVDTLVSKLAWLKAWLRAEAPALDSMTRPDGFVWLATAARVRIKANSRQARRLAKAGLKLPSRRLTLD